MRYVSFHISNFKGIQDLTFELESGKASGVYTLVGLNESGKTTILEALHLFYEQRKSEAVSNEPVLHTIAVDDAHNLVPKGKKDNFNGDIRLEATVHLDVDELNEVKRKIEAAGLVPTALPEEVEISIRFSFANSSFRSVKTYFTLPFKARKKRAKKERLVSAVDKVLWAELVKFVSDSLPPVIYYPNFLFDFPDRIYIEEQAGEGKEARFYRQFLQDVLDSLENNLSLTQHVLARAKSQELGDREALESVISKASSRISSLVFNKD